MSHSEIYKQIHSRVIFGAKEYQKKISFSQYSVYKKCPYQWYLTYGLGNFPFTSTMNTVFGTAMHETIQEWLTIMYTKTIKASEEFSRYTFLKERMNVVYKEEKSKNPNGHFSTPEEMEEFYEDGCAILKYLKTHRTRLFDTKNLELIGIEIPLYTQVLDDNDVFVFNAFLDIIFYDKVNDSIIIMDFKTSKRGWRDYEKKDQIKQQQLLLYKKFFSKQMGISEDKIECKFIILKRKVYEDSDYPQPRVQTHIPANGTGKINQAVRDVQTFITECFDLQTGKPLIDKQFEKHPSTDSCKFCPYLGRPEMCDRKN